MISINYDYWKSLVSTCGWFAKLPWVLLSHRWRSKFQRGTFGNSTVTWQSFEPLPSRGYEEHDAMQICVPACIDVLHDREPLESASSFIISQHANKVMFPRTESQWVTIYRIMKSNRGFQSISYFRIMVFPKCVRLFFCFLHKMPKTGWNHSFTFWWKQLRTHCSAVH